MYHIYIHIILYIHILTYTHVSGNQILSALFEGDKHRAYHLLHTGYNPNDVETQYGWTPLQFVAHTGDVHLANELIQYGADINLPCNDGWTPLIIACREGHLDMVQLLLKHSANPHVVTRNAMNAVLAAEQSGNIDIYHLISSVIRSSEQGQFHINKHGVISLSLQAAHTGDYIAVQSVLSAGHDANDLSLKGHISPLMLAASIGSPESVELFLEHGANVDECDENGWTPLMFAVDSECIQCVQKLLDYGASVHVRNQEGHTASDIAISHDQPGMAQGLLNAAVCNAVADQNLDDIVALIEIGADPNMSCKHRSNYTPLIVACKQSDDTVVSYLLNHGADSNLSDLDGWTPLMFASIRRNIAVVSLLLDAKADPLLTNNGGTSAVSLAEKWDNTDVLELLEYSITSNSPRYHMRGSRHLPRKMPNDTAVTGRLSLWNLYGLL